LEPARQIPPLEQKRVLEIAQEETNMASDLNVVLVGGRLVADPELKTTPKGTSIASLRLASNRYYRTADGEFKKTNLFITAETFGKLAEVVASKKKKGDQLLVKGRLDLNEWTGKDGKLNKTYRIFAENVDFLPKREATSLESSPAVGADEPMADDEDAEEPPF